MAKQLFIDPFDTTAGTFQRGSLNPAGLSASYADLLTPSGTYQVLTISNMTDGYVDISLDGGANVFWTIPSGGREEFRAPPGQHIPSSVIVKARDGSLGSVPASGTLFAVAMLILLMLCPALSYAQPGAQPVKAIPYDSSLTEKATAGNPYRVDPTGTTPQPVTQSGAWANTCNAGTNLNTSALALESGGNLATVASEITNLDSKVIACNTGAVTVAASALPSGAATAAGQLPDGHNVTVDNGAGASAVNIQDGGNSITVDGTITANAGTNLNTSALALESGGNLASLAAEDFATQTTLAALDAKVVSCNTGAVTIAALPNEGQQTMANSVSTTIASNQSAIPVKSTTTSTTGNITANGQSVAISLVDYTNLTFTISGTYATANISFQGSIDGGTTYFAIQAMRSDSNTIETTSGSISNTTRSWRASVNGYTNFRVLTTAFGSGTAAIRIIATSIGADPTPGVGAHAVTQSGTWNVGTVTTLTNITNQGQIVDNAAFVDGTTRLNMVGFVLDEVAGTALTENDGAAARINPNRGQIFVMEDGATRGRWATVTAANALKVDNSAVTQPVSVASLPLPSGAATESTLSTLNSKVTAVDTGAVVISTNVHPTGMGTITTGSTNVTTAGTRVVLGTALTVKKCDIVAKEANTGTIWLGGTSVAAGNGIPLVALQRYTMEVSDRNNINLDSTANGEGVTYSCYS